MRKIYSFYRQSIALLFVLILLNVAYAQCLPKDIATNPDNYQNIEDPYALQRWDWRSQFWYGYRPSTPAPINYQINSPFYNIYNPNLFSLSTPSIKNYDPLNGWELITKNFGTSTNPINTPFFILYNKYTGLLRAFIQVNSNYQNSKGAMVTLRFKEGYKTAGTLSQVAEKSYSLQSLQGKAKLLTPNQYINGGQGSDNFFWLYADFHTLYDPCVCRQTSIMLLEAILFSGWDVVLETNGKAETIISNSPTAVKQVKNDDGSINFGTFQEVATQTKNGMQKMLDLSNGVFTAAQTFVNAFPELLPKNSGQDTKKVPLFKSLVDATGSNGQAAAVLKLLGLPEFLSGMLTKLAGGGTTPISVQYAQTDIRLKTSGTLIPGFG